jgi:cellulose synthase/poly-beta-1,6-N-acetylglucosamine synthase-like glycosyltransferase
MAYLYMATGLVTFFYFMLIVVFTTGWLKKRKNKFSNAKPSVFISVVVAVRNEENNLPALLNALKDQTYQNFELIIADDHSEDNTVQIFYENKDKNSQLVELNESQYGKKAALASAIPLAKGELIITTDADCIPGKFWLEKMVSFYEKEKPEFFMGPVKQSSENMIQQFFSLDFLSLQASGAGAAELGLPFMCNGANLAFKKSLWENIISTTNQKFASGDDVFLLHSAIQKIPRDKIRYFFSKKATITTKAPENIKAFFNQRIRWASKAKGYKNSMSLITSFTVFAMNAYLLFLGIISFFFPVIIPVFLGVLILKTMVDFPLLLFSAEFFKKRKLLIFYLPLQIIYFIYITFFAIYSIFGTYHWKERKVK